MFFCCLDGYYQLCNLTWRGVINHNFNKTKGTLVHERGDRLLARWFKQLLKWSLHLRCTCTALALLNNAQQLVRRT